MNHLIALTTFCLLLSIPAMAQDAPTPSPETLKQTENDLKQTEALKEKLTEETQALQKDLNKTTQNLLSLADRIGENEKNLTRIEGQIARQQAERAEIETRLNTDRGALSALIMALKRMDDVPRDVLMLKPGAPLETAQSALLLETILPRLYERANSLKTDLARLDELIKNLARDKQNAEKTALQLAEEQKKMTALLSDREKAYRRTAGDLKTQTQTARRLASEAQTLKDLIGRIEQNRQKQENLSRQNASLSRLKTAPPPKMGAGRLPVSGTIKVGFEQTDDIGAQSQGLTLDARPGALVVSPLGGVVRYTGEFMNYGPMVIIEHQKDYHSLIAGLGKIDTVVGQSVLAGEPVGRLGNSGFPSLYYELRHNGQPVNPGRILKY
ncbi:MAG: peptidoglycan DD-metalloendopeptidase family protein [Alphaproteobacteria bacterium]|nr:peptidoglycan DD-metalloendopeptidase family protein [Alphaproteobacteria bacterium]